MIKKKIFNDPIYGLMSFDQEVIYKIIDHPYFQRLRRISQLALSHYVFPGAQHTRFQHALGSLHLMTQTIQLLRSKGIEISEDENRGVCIAILLHDIGHGPFSHALEGMLLPVSHEKISLKVMEIIENDLGEDFTIAKKIYKNEYPRKFLNQLVSSQLDIDRMDYLTRDSFFSGVAEGIIGYDRIIKMFNVVDDILVVEENGIYSVENFLVARKLMYWQVYLHKTAIVSEQMLVSTVKRISWLVQNDPAFPCSDSLKEMILHRSDEVDHNIIKRYLDLDDVDILYTIKKGMFYTDKILSILCKNLLDRNLFKIHFTNERSAVFSAEECKENIKNQLLISEEDLPYFYIEKKETFLEYNRHKDEIMILLKSGEVVPFSFVNPEFDEKKSVGKDGICYWVK
ncbi:MAG: HD domain-containing protein [Saprospiraceae bacterium]|nr:HD domain-containing protein [Saprospiraceae bacterium]MBK9042412.1 HD domain-containing protein [Saprospiraceae bacterium]